MPDGDSGHPRAVIVGGGVAGLEALLALHALAGERAELVIVSPDPDFLYPALDSATTFPSREPFRIDQLLRRFDGGPRTIAFVVPAGVAWALPLSLHLSSDVAEEGGEGVVSLDQLWWPANKISARYLAPLLEHGEEGFAEPEPPRRMLDVEVSLPKEWHREPMALDPHRASHISS